jgi:hypothetical protein
MAVCQGRLADAGVGRERLSADGGMEDRERFVRGTLAATLGVVAAGLGALAVFRMWDWALGLLSGALVSLVSFRLIVASVTRLTEQAAPRRRAQRGWWIWSLLRLLAAAVVLLLVVFYLPVNLIGVALGLSAVQLGMGGYLLVRAIVPQSSTVETEDQ